MTTKPTSVQVKVKVKVSYTGYDWDDKYTMTSPTGRRLDVKPNGHWSHGSADLDRRLTEAEESVLQRIQNHTNTLGAYWGDEKYMEVSFDEMKLFLSASTKTR